MKHANWKCPRCGHAEFQTGELRASGGALSSMFDVETARFTTVSCVRCTYTELYRTAASNIDNVLDFFVG